MYIGSPNRSVTTHEEATDRIFPIFAYGISEGGKILPTAHLRSRDTYDSSARRCPQVAIEADGEGAHRARLRVEETVAVEPIKAVAGADP